MITKKRVAPIATTRFRFRSDDGNAFVPDPSSSGRSRVKDVLAEQLAEEFLTSAISGEDSGLEAHDRVFTEERGGPFVPSSARKEFGYAPDASNPLDAEPAAFPTTRAKRRPFV